MDTPLRHALALFVLAHAASASISCYTCSSRNGSDVNCEDPYHPAMSTYTQNCMVPKEHHIGKFPANFCVKVIGESYYTGETLVIRTCILENMESQCGVFRFEQDTLKGCVLTCNYDGCNSAQYFGDHLKQGHLALPLLLFFSIFVQRIYS